MCVHVTFFAVSFVRRIYNADFKMRIYLQIARLFLEEQDHISAEAYINRAAMLQSEVPDKELQIKYKVSREGRLYLLFI